MQLVLESRFRLGRETLTIKQLINYVIMICFLHIQSSTFPCKKQGFVKNSDKFTKSLQKNCAVLIELSSRHLPAGTPRSAMRAQIWPVFLHIFDIITMNITECFDNGFGRCALMAIADLLDDLIIIAKNVLSHKILPAHTQSQIRQERDRHILDVCSFQIDLLAERNASVRRRSRQGRRQLGIAAKIRSLILHFFFSFFHFAPFPRAHSHFSLSAQHAALPPSTRFGQVKMEADHQPPPFSYKTDTFSFIRAG